MQRYVFRRLGQALLVLWAAFTIVFVLLQAMPGDALMIKYQNPDMGLSPTDIEDESPTGPTLRWLSSTGIPCGLCDMREIRPRFRAQTTTTDGPLP
jgi:ABC-type dipeptide/oligopeptide/nickel transport system permease component